MAEKKVNKATGRSYVSDTKYESQPAQVKARTARNSARLKMEQKLGKAAIEGKDVDHKKPLAEGGTNDLKNLRLRSPAANRARKKG